MQTWQIPYWCIIHDSHKFKKTKKIQIRIYLDYETAVHTQVFGRCCLQVICFGCTVSVNFCDLQEHNLLKSHKNSSMELLVIWEMTETQQPKYSNQNSDQNTFFLYSNWITGTKT